MKATARIPAQSHGALRRIRAFHLRATADVLRRLQHGDRRSAAAAVSFECR